MRIVSLAPSNTEILYALGAEDDVVAVTQLCLHPKEALQKVRIGSWTKTRPEEIAGLSPDLILTSIYLPPELRDYDGPGSLLHVDPKDLEGVFDSIITIGKAVGRERQAGDLFAALQQDFPSQKPRTERPRVYSEEWPSPPMVSGNWVPDLLRLADSIPLGVAGQPSRTVSFEEVETFDPDIILLHWCGYGNRDVRRLFMERPGSWKNLRAAREGRVVVIEDSLLNTPGPRLTEGFRHISSLLR